ncbi:MAG: alanine--tRNA ligase [Nitrosopumilus sp.]|nr:alanine--tRNA ligase [Nitrosopumilus sp.]
MTSNEIRKQFLDFFKSKEHKIVPSAPMVLKNDPSLMFTNAGMNQFKDYFLGNSEAQYKRIADTQKCLRVSGKHNDLEEVGIDTYHHTMFEMLGNWSFGNYFKKEAIGWAWELLTDVYKLPKDRLYVTVFEGDKKEGLEFDQEAFDYWKKLISEDRILRGNKKDNFWEMGDTGPCGPCSEIHIDLRDDAEIKKKDGKELVNAGDPEVIEIWNLVFIQFNRKSDGNLNPLPAKHVDTGMGFERLCMAMQGKKSNYDTDVFQPLIQHLTQISGISYKVKEETDIAMRVIADHIRAISFAIADGQLPSNNKAGYVIRRILRRAVRYGYTFLNLKEPFLFSLVNVLAKQFEDVFPELKAQEDLISRVIKEEETSFLRTLGIGIQRFENYKGDIVAGEFIFELYDTFGFPADLTQLLAREKNKSVDMEGFQREMQKQKERSRQATTQDTGDWVLLKKEQDTAFIGYETTEADVELIKYRKLKTKNKEVYQLVFDQTPFYAESGGQVGDAGFIEAEGKKYFITDTKKENNLTVHFADKLPDDPTLTFTAKVDAHRRKLIKANHSATHLMHAALRNVLGTHVAQKGSLVNEEHTRFDFSHFAKVTDEEIKRIEKLVNEKVREIIKLDEKHDVPIKEATEMGAMALFGEKYGDSVRVITFGPDYSIELCGGTHVNATGEIGLFKIVSEGSVAAGIRRIEAITSEKAEQYVYEQEEKLNELKATLNNPKDLKKSVEILIGEKQKLQDQLNILLQEKVKSLKEELLSKVEKIGDINFIAAKIDLPSADLIKNLSYELKQQVENILFVAGAEIEDKAHLSIIISENLVKEKGLNASALIRELSKEIQGGGGGQDFYATAGGKNPAGIENALKKAKEVVSSLVSVN